MNAIQEEFVSDSDYSQSDTEPLSASSRGQMGKDALTNQTVGNSARSVKNSARSSMPESATGGESGSSLNRRPLLKRFSSQDGSRAQHSDRKKKPITKWLGFDSKHSDRLRKKSDTVSTRGMKIR